MTLYRRPSVTPTVRVYPSVGTDDPEHGMGSRLRAERGQSWKPLHRKAA